MITNECSFIIHSCSCRPFHYLVSTLLNTLDRWTPALQIRTVLLSVQALMSSPNPDDPLDENVAKVWIEDVEKAKATGRSRSYSIPFQSVSKEL